MMKEHDMTYTIDRLERSPDWATWLAAAGIDYTEVPACPDPACEVCRAAPEAAAAEVAAAA